MAKSVIKKSYNYINVGDTSATSHTRIDIVPNKERLFTTWVNSDYNSNLAGWCKVETFNMGDATFQILQKLEGTPRTAIRTYSNGL